MLPFFVSQSFFKIAMLGYWKPGYRKYLVEQGARCIEEAALIATVLFDIYGTLIDISTDENIRCLQDPSKWLEYKYMYLSAGPVKMVLSRGVRPEAGPGGGEEPRRTFSRDHRRVRGPRGDQKELYLDADVPRCSRP